ncbi:Protein BREAST CANCER SUSCEPTIBILITY like [Actinidia chinensis var. chinensis]|uniref:Protein BREAST CANCER SUSCEPTIBILITY like n=1 Tax=Actinidia chinensis var. chinensis TaxID=1590841 RepID=A0A2R6QZE8_ACTCC|nr:Protein BREAST CANCER SUSCEPTIBILITY like [Actinidia chinensis var. chinensis]
MGRELKCPICLSLLNSAVSLTCNHVFCNLCIEKSMKFVSSCPVCKVPYRRREVRPAPHMDTLVSIYKNMEVASGFKIFVTQTGPSAKLSDEDNLAGGSRICGRQKSDRTCQAILENQRRCKGKRSKLSLNIDHENSSLDPVKPSFPTKKRVQVPQYPPPSDTPVQPRTFESGCVEITKVQLEKNSVGLKEKPAVNEKGEPVFTPFFWLRDDEDVEKLTQQTDGGDNMDTPPNAPCFSDIKDSADEIPTKVVPERETNTSCNDVNCFDSEMFEWTQRPCSPELCSKPMETQVSDTDEFDGIQVKDCKLSTQAVTTNGKHGMERMENVVSKQRTDNVEVSSAALSPPKIADANTDDRMRNSNKRGRKVSERTKKKQAKRIMNEALLVQVDLEKVTERTIHEKIHNNKVTSLDLSKKTHKRGKKVMFHHTAVECAPEKVSAISTGANSLNLDNKTMITDLSGSLSDQKESIIKTIARVQKDHPKRSRIKTAINSKCVRELRCSKKLKISPFDVSKDNLVNGVQDGCDGVSAKNTRPFGKLQFNSEVRGIQDSTELEKVLPALDGAVLRRCETVPKKIQCAFCHSTEDCEASGDMVHYLNGKPVSADYNGGSKVIHAHRNCTEWAPNIYFEDDNAINLEAELARSRRIKCCCCDVRGAALGCYENSCRKSFHVPCAKLIAECRWDNDNFVMLCPLHASSKLPNEMSGSQIKRKNNCIPKLYSTSDDLDIIDRCILPMNRAPNIYFEDDNAINLEAELARSRRIKCCCCDVRGAALGCYENSCRKSFHVPCAKLIAECRWDNDNFVMLCPLHASSKLPNEMSGSQIKRKNNCIPKRPFTVQQLQVAVKHASSACQRWISSGSCGKLVLCCSALKNEDKEIVSEFERFSGAKVLKNWDSSVTHVIASTDENGACRRTLKILMGILEGKWILSIEWIKACMMAMKPVDEQLYEIGLDVHGIRDGPRIGRLRVLNKQQKLFDGCKFYFTGEFVPSYKRYLHDLIIVAGGTVLQRKPIPSNQESMPFRNPTSSTFIIYSLESPDKCDPNTRNLIFSQRRLDAEALASSTEAIAASNSWVLNSIAACKLQYLPK